MKVEVSHCIDASEPDAEGFHDYYYEYHVFSFTDGIVTYLARSYSDEPEKAALIALHKGGTSHLLTKRDLCHPVFLEATAYLRTAGKSDLVWLDSKSQEYLPLINPDE